MPRAEGTIMELAVELSAVTAKPIHVFGTLVLPRLVFANVLSPMSSAMLSNPEDVHQMAATADNIKLDLIQNVHHRGKKFGA